MTNQLLLSDLQAFIIDMDGVLWRGDTPLPGLKPLFEMMEQRQIAFMMATNNATKTPEQYIEKFAKFGVTMPPDRLMTSSLATAEFMKTQYPAGTRIHVVGQDGIRQALTLAGFEICDTDVEAVVVGLDFALTYEKLRTAAMLINKGARYIGTNGDLTFPFEDGQAPGNGAVLAAITAATGQTPTLVGKPEPIIFEMALAKLGTDRDKTVMIGDRLETDIFGAHGIGLKTLLVLSGISQPADVETSPIKPNWVFQGIDAMVNELQS
ncbi:MAG: HAD-IIA family hydrolase [Chloroflexota bacterium]